MYTALKKLGKKVEFVRYPREGHCFDEPVHIADSIERAVAWVDRYIGKEVPLRYSGEEIIYDKWCLQLISLAIVPDYAGVKPQGRFLEIFLLLEDRYGSNADWQINPLEEISLKADDGTIYHPAGIVMVSSDKSFLLKSSNASISLKEKDGDNRALSIRVAFDLPSSVFSAMLKVKDLPPFEIRLPPK